MRLKKIILLSFLLAILVGMSGALNAQDSLRQFHPEWAVGIRQGYQFSRVNFSPGVAQGLLPGFSSGLVFQFLSQPQLGIQLEVNYSQLGWTEPSLSAPEQYRRELTYIEVPFLTHFAIGKKSFRGVLNIGSYLSYLIKEKEFIRSDQTRVYEGLAIGHPWSFGFCGGLGIALRSRVGVFQLEARGATGLTELFSSSNGVFNSATELYFGGQLSYLYRFRKKQNTPASDETPTDHF